MKITKITKMLPVVLALALTTGCAFAAGGADASSTANAEYTLNLADYIKITHAEGTKTATVSYGTDYATATLDAGGLAGTFKVISNNTSQIVYLKGECEVSGGGKSMALYGADEANPNNLKLVFSNTSHLPEAADVENITGGSAAQDKNPDAIGFPLIIEPTHTGGPTETPITVGWDTDKLKYTLKNGTATFPYTIDGQNDANTFSTHDTDGTYKATLTMYEVTD